MTRHGSTGAAPFPIAPDQPISRKVPGWDFKNCLEITRQRRFPKGVVFVLKEAISFLQRRKMKSCSPGLKRKKSKLTLNRQRYFEEPALELKGLQHPQALEIGCYLGKKAPAPFSQQH